MDTSLSKFLVLTLLVLVLTGPVAVAQMSPSVSSWSEGPVQFLLLEEERVAFHALSSDEEAQAFIDLFWARRDPDLTTPENEFKVEFDARVQAADAEFSSEGERGALSSRGQVLILLGPPSKHARMPIIDYFVQLYNVPPPYIDPKRPDAHIVMKGVTFNPAKGQADLWGYDAKELPGGLTDGEVEELTFAFFDNSGTGDWHLQGGIRRAQAAAAALERAPAVLLVNPDLSEVPVIRVLDGVDPADAQHLEALAASSWEWPEDGLVLSEQGVASSSNLPNWFFVLLPPETAAVDLAAGRVLADGEEIATFQTPLKSSVNALGSGYDFALPAIDGEGTVELGLFAADSLIAAQSIPISNQQAAPQAVHFSTVFAGADISVNKDAEAGAPFVFGGYHLSPRPEGRYTTAEHLSLFCLAAIPPELGPDAQQAKVRMRWYVGGKPTPKTAPKDVTLLPAGPGVWVWGTQLPLGSMSAGTEYMLKIKISSAVGTASRTTEIPVIVRNKTEVNQ